MIEAGSKVALESGTDTNIIGTQVRGEQVVADVGTSGEGNLNIQSLQDTSTYDSKQKSAGISVSVPIGAGSYGGSVSVSNSKINSDYASVNEQAIQDGKNNLTTETLTIADIQNKAEYEGEGSSATVGYGSQGGLPQLSGAGYGEDSDKTDSATVSAISQGTVNITDNDTQKTLTGKDANITVALLNRDVHVNEQGEAVDSQGNSTANTIAPIFDKEKVQKEIEAQMKITQTFSQEAPRALNTFAQEKIKPYRDANNTLREAKTELEQTTDPEKQQRLQNIIIEAEQAIANTQADYDKWKEGGEYRVASNIIIAAISGGSSGAVSTITKESLAWAANIMRQNMIEDSMKFPGICVNENDCISNMSGKSEGVNGDGKKVGGGRIVLDKWCDEGRCERDENTKSGWKENEDHTVIFNAGKDENGNSLTISQFIEQHPEMISPLGGHQGGQGLIGTKTFYFEYAPHSFLDKLVESFAGTHDTFNSFIWYDDLGNGKDLKGLAKILGDVTNATNVPLATPFALSVLLPPEVWSAALATIRVVKP